MSAITFSTHRFDVLGVVRRSWKTAAGAILPFALLPLALSDAKVKARRALNDLS